MSSPAAASTGTVRWVDCTAELLYDRTRPPEEIGMPPFEKVLAGCAS